MSLWTEDRVKKLRELWGKGNTASQIAEIIGGISRNAVIGKAHRLNLSAKIKARPTTKNQDFKTNNEKNQNKYRQSRRNRFKSLLIDKDFEPENPKQLEELDENFLTVNFTCYMHSSLKVKKRKFLIKRTLKNLSKKKFKVVDCLI